MTVFLNSLILFLSALGGGLLFLIFPQTRKWSFRNILMLAGSYLFSITVVHILPEVYVDFPNPGLIGIFILIGFFLQLVLVYFSKGIEHGHIHSHTPESGHSHFHSSQLASLMIGLGVHSFLEGMIVAQPSGIVVHHPAGGVLLGIVIHKIPVAFSLMAVFYYGHMQKFKAFLYLFLFSMVSPAGYIFNQFLNFQAGLPQVYVSMLSGVVSGTFLYISTTIFFETSPGHHFSFTKLMYAISGGALAILVEIFI